MMFNRVAISVAAAVFGVVTAADAAVMYSQTQSGAVAFPDSTPVVLTFTGAITPVGNGTLSLVATGGELANNGKRLEQLKVDGDTYQTPGQPAGWMLPVNFLDSGAGSVSPITIPQLNLSTYAADGQVVVSVVRPGFISGGTFDITLSYEGVPEPASLALLGAAALVLIRRR